MGVFEATATKSTGDGTWEIPEDGQQPGVLVGIIDLGSHRETYEDKNSGKSNESKPHKIYLLWELTEAPMSGTRGNHLIGQKYTLSLNEKSGLAKLLKGWGVVIPEGQKYDIENKLGEPCMVTVNHKPSKDGTKTYAELGAVTPLHKSMKGKTAPAKTKPFVWAIPGTQEKAREAIKEIERMAFLPRIYGEKIPDVIQASIEWGDLKRGGPAAEATTNGQHSGGEGVAGEEPDEIPF